MAGRLVPGFLSSSRRLLVNMRYATAINSSFSVAYYSSEVSSAEMRVETGNSDSLEKESEAELHCEVKEVESTKDPLTECKEKPSLDSTDEKQIKISTKKPKTRGSVPYYLTKRGEVDERYKPFSPSKDVSTYKKGSFEDLFKNSNFVRTVNPVDKDVEGVVIAVENDKMYVDFGGKFHGVTNLPEDTFGCHVGARVVVTVKELEAVGHFIGDFKHHSLMEAAIQFKRLI